MGTEAFTLRGVIIYWDSVILALGLCAGLLLSAGLYRAGGGRRGAFALFAPAALVLGTVCARALYWYCHMEQFQGLGSALVHYSVSGLSLPGAFVGVCLAGLAVKWLGLVPEAGALFDALAPGAALALGVVRLSFLFNTLCRSKIVLTDPQLQKLPLGIALETGNGLTEYRFATFFVEALAFFAVFLLLLWLFWRRRGRGRGDVALLWLLLYSMVELVCDSTRYDALFFPFNAFISVVQIFSALAITAVTAVFSVRSVKRRGLRPWHFVLWAAFLAAIGCCGYLEYLVQRHGNWYPLCYTLMTAGALLLAGDGFVLWHSGREEPEIRE